MTDRAAPGAQGSTVRNMEFGEMGGAPAPFLVPYDESPSRAAQRWDSLDMDPPEESDNGPFHWTSWRNGENYIGISPGEGYVDGWFATDERKNSPDLEPYEEQRITLVVGWDPDAVYSSDIHDTREEADRVFVEVEQNVDDDIPYIPVFEGRVIDDSEGGYRFDTDTIVDKRPIGRPLETIPTEIEADYWQKTSTEGPGVTLLRGRPTTFTGAVNTGPHETPVNAERTVHAFAPVDADAEPGTEAEYHDLDVAGTPAGRYRYAHAEGGVAYGTRYDAAVGRLSRINANLSWEYTEFGEVPGWFFEESGTEHDVALSEYPRRVELSVGDSDAGANGGVASNVLVSPDSLGSFRITFRDFDYTDVDNSRMFTGVSSASPDTGVYEVGSGLGIYRNRNDYFLRWVDDGAADNNSFSGLPDWPADVTLEYRHDEGEARIYADGEWRASLSDVELESAVRPMMWMEDNEPASETVSMEQYIVEVIE